MKKIVPKEGQESGRFFTFTLVWDYPRPPRLEKTSKHIEIYFQGEKIVDSKECYRVLETSHPPSYYIPQKDAKMEYFKPLSMSTYCEWKGKAKYYSVYLKDKSVDAGVWSYPTPTKDFEPIKNFLAFYPSKFDCYVNGEKVVAQEGDFYGGWITSDIVGPFKGGPSTMFW